MAKSCTVLMLDDSQRQFPISSNLMGAELFSMVASQYGLREKIYFGLSYVASNNDHDHMQEYEEWLDLNRSVKDQFSRFKAIPLLTFAVRFYIPDVRLLKELATQRLFFLHALRLVSSGRIECNNQAMELAALALQITQGDFIDESATRHHLDAKKLISDEVLVAEGSSLEACARKVSATYQTLIGMDAATAILAFMTIAQSLPQYGIHFYNVKDAKGVPWALGVHNNGINEYLFSDRVTPRNTCAWTDVVNISFNKNKFLLELESDQQERPHSVTGNGSSSRDKGSRWARRKRARSSGTSSGKNTVTKGWTTPSAEYAKTLLTAAVEQHKYHLRATREQDRVMLAPLAQRSNSIAVDTFSSSRSSDSLAPRSRAASNSAVDKILAKVREQSSNSLASQPTILEEVELVNEPREAADELDRLEKRHKQLQNELERQINKLEKLEEEERDWLAAARTQSLRRPQSVSPRRARRASAIASALSPLSEGGMNDFDFTLTGLNDMVDTSISKSRRQSQLMFAYDEDDEDILPLRLAMDDPGCLPLRLSISDDPPTAMNSLLEQAHVNNTSDFSLRVAALATPEPEEEQVLRNMPASNENSLSDLLNDDELRALVKRINDEGQEEEGQESADVDANGSGDDSTTTADGNADNEPIAAEEASAIATADPSNADASAVQDTNTQATVDSNTPDSQDGGEISESKPLNGVSSDTTNDKMDTVSQGAANAVRGGDEQEQPTTGEDAPDKQEINGSTITTAQTMEATSHDPIANGNAKSLSTSRDDDDDDDDIDLDEFDDVMLPDESSLSPTKTTGRFVGGSESSV
eukprot:TRINITY_DN11359_c2_g4_i3.p1 TRINITY_DN11359_c2_g4~~TRINITY_DN11359_c2_g4_i3.p1  ORF type:complete len:816 (+),score=211.32 TRINITY_DN11359_c2_g4_i3:173-2620(+)